MVNFTATQGFPYFIQICKKSKNVSVKTCGFVH